MKRLQQLTPNTCGQTCLAMFILEPLSEVLKEIPDSPAGTDSAQLRGFLQRRGYRVSEMESVRPHVLASELPQTGFVRVRWGTKPGDRRAHWVLRVHGRWLDPLTDNEPFFLTRPGGRVLSYFEVLL